MARTNKKITYSKTPENKFKTKNPEIPTESEKSIEVTPSPQPTETLSSLLKKFDAYVPTLENITNETAHWITKSRIKQDWVKETLVLKNNKCQGGKTIPKDEKETYSRSAESVALCSAELLEKTIQELENIIEKINSEKDEAKAFARNCFSYLNKVHKNTCLGEAGKIMLELFDEGNLSGNIILGLIEKAEEISTKKQLPYANKLTFNQSKAINFMVEERDLRITPTIDDLQQFLFLYQNLIIYTPLLKALTYNDLKEAKRLINNLS